jgi:hypothetical protein
MNNRRIALGLSTGAGALLGAAILSGLTSPIAAADDFAVEPIPVPTGADYTNPETISTMPALGGLGTDTVSEEYLANYDVSGATPVLATGTEAGYETELINTYSNPLFTDTSTDITSAFVIPPTSDDAGALAGNVGTETDTLLLDPSSGEDFGISVLSVPSATAGDAPTVTEDLITPLGQFPITDLSSLLGGSDLTSLLGASDVSSLLGGGDLLTGLDPVLQLLTSF